MSHLSSDKIQECINGVFEIQAALKQVSRRLSAVAEMDAPDDNEIFSLSLVADLCVRSLDNVAEMLERAKAKEKRVA